jgi:hypothetical protein
MSAKNVWGFPLAEGRERLGLGKGDGLVSFHTSVIPLLSFPSEWDQNELGRAEEPNGQWREGVRSAFRQPPPAQEAASIPKAAPTPPCPESPRDSMNVDTVLGA